MNLSHVLTLHAKYRPNKIAVRDRERKFTYAELERAIQNLANGLGAIGVKSGDVVGIGLGDCIEHLVALYAVARMGAIVLPMDVRWKPGETGRVLAEFEAGTVLLENSGFRQLSESELAVPAITERIVVRNSEGTEGITDLKTLMDTGAKSGREMRETADMTDRPLTIALTSGTTGNPKGAVISHGQMLARFMANWAHLSFHGEDRYLSATPIFHGAGRTFCMSHLYLGASVVLSGEKFEVEGVLEEIAAHAITTIFLVPTQLRRLLEFEPLENFDRSSLRVVISSGTALSPALRSAVMERFSPNLFDYYGSTDGGGISLLRPEDQETHPDSVGHPMLHMEVRIFDSKGRETSPGNEGEVCYRGPGVSGGYLNNPQATRETFRDGWFHSGDLGRLDENGFLYITGRIKDIIIRGGVNIYPAEIEAVLTGHPLVREAAVLGVASTEYGEEGVAFVVTREKITVAEIMEFCSTRLAGYKVPRQTVIVEEIPRNVGGKVIREELIKRLAPNENP